MSLNLEAIQEMWEKDAKIDRDNLHEESLNIPSLHAKYFELYNTTFLLRKKAEQQRKNIRCLLYTSPSPRDKRQSRMPSSA